eukprot:1150642_1
MARVLTQPPFEEKLEIHSVDSYPKRPNNTVRTFMEGIDFYTALQERCRDAKYSIWCAVSFGDWDFQFPDNQHWWALFKQLKLESPSLTIRVLFWRNIDKRWGTNGVIMGTQKDDSFIKKNRLHQFNDKDKNGIQFKWDESPTPSHCHHGKYFVIDAETNHNLQNIYCFVGGMTMNKCVYLDSRHDTVIEINGPSSVDVISNFKMRWNHNNIFNACVAMDTCKPLVTRIDEYSYITDTNEEKKQNHLKEGVDAKVCASFYPKIYPGYELGESGIHSAYYKAFINAKKSIYIESQHPGDSFLLQIMKWKLQNIKDFQILFIVPIRMMWPIVQAKRECIEYDKNTSKTKEPRYYSMFSTLSSLKALDNFCLCGMYKSHTVDKVGVYESIYVHSKLCIVDGEWFTIGSANFVDISFIHDHSELNVCVFNANEAIKLMRKLACKHCEKKDKTFKKMQHVDIVKYMMKTAVQNVKRKESKRLLDGRLYALDPQLYAS